MRIIWRIVSIHNGFSSHKKLDICFVPLAKFETIIALWAREVFIFLVNNQLDAQLFMYVYFYSPGRHVPIIRRIIVSMRHLVYVTVCR